MKPKRIALLLCLYMSFLSPVAFAQEDVASLSLETALTRTYRSNASLWRLRQEQMLWKARILQAQLGPNPELSLMSEDFVGSAAFTQDRFTQFTLGLAQTLVMGNKIVHRTRLVQVQQQLAYWDYRLQLQNLGAEVYRSYVALLNLEAQRKLVVELAENARTQHSLLSKVVQTGRLAPSALLQSESIVRGFEAEVIELDLAAQARRAELAALWGATEPDFSQLGGTFPQTEWGTFESLETCLQIHPRLARWQFEGQQRQAALDTAQAQAAPDLNVSGGLRYHPPLELGLVLSVGIPFAIVNGNQGNIEEARLRNESWRKEREFEESSLRAQLRKAYGQMQGHLNLIKVLTDQVRLGEAQRAAALKAFEGGKIDYLGLLLASQNRDQLRRRLVETQNKYLLTEVEVIALTRELLPEVISELPGINDDIRR